MRLVHGVVQHYDWGDTQAIPSLLGMPPDGRPWAEYWLGTHPLAPSSLDDGAPLASATGELPFLLKLLAAARPLSLQTHPTTAQAAAGFAREQAEGLAVDHPRRVYRDPFAKPELLCALTPFDTLCGFRPVDDSLDVLGEIGANALASALAADGLPLTVEALYRGRFDMADTLAACADSNHRAARLVTDLRASYPDDPSIVVTLLMHRVVLQPGEAVFLGAGNLHAYLNGTGVELMASSDNVVRGGLTSKHVDVDELLRVLDISPLADPVVRPVEVDPGCFHYPTPPVPFVLFRRELRDGHALHRADGRELLLCTSGDLGALRAGEAMFLADDDAVDLAGTGTVFIAAER
jgi:mannose-6-phosphate isomerase